MTQSITFQQYLAFEHASLQVIATKKILVDMAGDLVAGILLSQIIYWYLPTKEWQDSGGKHGKITKLRISREGHLWLVKRRTDWWDEVRLTPKQVDRAVRILKGKDIIITKVLRFKAAPTVHIRINETEFERRLSGCLPQLKERDSCE